MLLKSSYAPLKVVSVVFRKRNAVSVATFLKSFIPYPEERDPIGCNELHANYTTIIKIITHFIFQFLTTSAIIKRLNKNKYSQWRSDFKNSGQII